MLPRFGLALLLWFMSLICAFSAFVERAEAQEADRELDLSQGAAQEPGLTQPGVDYIEHRYADDGGSFDGLEDGVDHNGLAADDGSYRANYPSDLDSHTITWEEVNSEVLGFSKEAIQDPEPNTAALNGANNEAYVVQPNGIDFGFIRHQEEFRLGAYVPDPEFSRSGVTIGTGVDIGQLSVADIDAFDIPQELKQKLKPYAGLIRQDAVHFLNNYPLYLTEDEAYALDRVVTQDTIDGLTNRYNAAASGKLFTELPPEAQTAITDIAFQYGSNLEQRMPNFWSDVTEGRWKSVVQKLRNFGDRYPTRRNAEADLLERAIDRGDLGAYVVQPGDTLSEIASRLGISIEHLVAHNDIADPDIVYSGQVLYH